MLTNYILNNKVICSTSFDNPETDCYEYLQDVAFNAGTKPLTIVSVEAEDGYCEVTCRELMTMAEISDALGAITNDFLYI